MAWTLGVTPKPLSWNEPTQHHLSQNLLYLLDLALVISEAQSSGVRRLSGRDATQSLISISAIAYSQAVQAQ